MPLKARYLVQVLTKGHFGEMISFELHLEKWHEKTQKPLWFLGFPNRYLFRFAMLAYSTKKDDMAFWRAIGGFRSTSYFFCFFTAFQPFNLTWLIRNPRNILKNSCDQKRCAPKNRGTSFFFSLKKSDHYF